MNATTNGVVRIHGREYKTVAKRVAEFRENFPAEEGWSIVTEIVSIDEEVVVMKAMIKNDLDKIVGCGFAEERRSASQINRTSALENCETSAIGRALASCGYGGEEYASANEVVQAVAQQRSAPSAPAPAPEQRDEEALPPDLTLRARELSEALGLDTPQKKQIWAWAKGDLGKICAALEKKLSIKR